MNDENTIYDNEKTQYQSQDEEATQYDAATNGKATNAAEQNTSGAQEQPAQAKRKITWKQVSVGGVSGILLGAAGSLLMGSTTMEKVSEEDDGKEHDQGNHDITGSSDWSDGEVPIASSVTDDMSFSEAFAAAREEVGPGGAFEWHGQVYGTYLADEWNAMTPEEHEAYYDHFNWNNYSSDYVEDIASVPGTPSATVSPSAPATPSAVPASNPDPSIEPNAAEPDVVVVTPDEYDEPTPLVDVQSEVQVLGVVHDPETGANVGGVLLDGQEVVLLDVDGDQTFDYMGADVNGDEQLSENEVVDISDQHITTDDLVGFLSDDGSLYASNDSGLDAGVDSSTFDV